MISEKEIKKNPMFLYLAVLTICSTIGLQAWLTLFNNFAVMSFGFHYYETTNMSLTLQYFDALSSPDDFPQKNTGFFTS